MKIINTSTPWENEYKQSRQAPIYEQLWKILQEFLKNSHGKSILDYGCGDGNYSILMHNMGFKVIGIDVSSNAIEIAENSCSTENLTFHIADSVPEKFPENSFDIVIMLNVLHCLSNWKRAELLGQTRRVLKNKGHFFASVLSTNDESYPRHEWTEVEPSTFDDGSGKLFHFFSLEEITNEFEFLNISHMDILENVHPEVGKKSALHIIAGQNEK
ncbi:MAG: class I SAM-dependent methyltransferase [Desulfobacterales bacterium]|nr:class I SAM-dependent methyltransferase [Desulfobacterales bacterium]